MPDERTPAAPETMHEAAWRWLLTCPYIEELFLGFATAREGGTVLVPLTACMDSAEREFVDGSSIRNYDFTIIRFCLYSAAPNDGENLEALAALAGWPAGSRRRTRSAGILSCPRAARRSTSKRCPATTP